MVKRKMPKPANNIMWYGGASIVIIIVVLVSITRTKENLGFRNLIKDDKKRDEFKKICQSKGGNWKRGGDLITDTIWGKNATCITYKIDNKMVGGYCCYDKINPLITH